MHGGEDTDLFVCSHQTGICAMTSLLLRNATVLLTSGLTPQTDVRVVDGLVDRIGPALAAAGADVFDAAGAIVAPGFLDIHVHGAGGAMFEQGTPEAVAAISAALPRHGVTACLATVATLAPEPLHAAVAAVADAAPTAPGARILGIHLEGPYLNPRRAGAQDGAAMRPASIEELDALQDRSGGRIRLVTLAPELPGAATFVAAARARGVTVAVGHSDATAAEVQAALAAGATHVTHLFNGMRELHHREPGITGAALTEDGLSVEVICDGHHLAPRVVDLVFRCKPPGQVVLVSDAVGALGMPDGAYEMFGVRCVIGDGTVRIGADGPLAGSCLGLDRAVRNVRRWLPTLPVAHVLAAASAAAARVIGERDAGAIAEGRTADLVVLDATLEVVATVCRGRIAWQR